ncbi:beta-ketoacyl synthase N-terminal-like domain-containing protein [Mesorhizobium sp. VK24D]|uniref:Beta-ketoacyl synthase N-terminal-like domain-containing protein n=1 Tax=Mesorhizobium album TaxID=3072314 RepID=A0ABU4XYF5_9HYPH|nr:beta-ketoacyl synthase N-terminal-like domain-containing protein [Mesorhizobium sp. VK24D]MDX8479730.1 beta-ketoacyl synthase N-terminal-like domain-containing protein [Mesorhizobium sp. VK24D]
MATPSIAAYVPKTPIWLAGLAARTPVGLRPESAAAAVRAGISAISEHPLFVDRNGEPMRLARDAVMGPDVPLAERMKELLLSTLLQLPQAAAPSADSLRTLLIICSPEPRPGLPDGIAETLGRAVLQRFGPTSLRVQYLARGHAAGMLAFGAAAKAIDEGNTDLAVVAGVDSYHEYQTLEWMDETGQLKSEVNRDGFFPGEAAGACLLARSNLILELGLQPLGRLTAVSTALERITIKRHGEEEVCVGEGLSSAFLGLGPAIDTDRRKITDTYCDLNGQRYRSEELVYAILRVQHLSDNASHYLHPADCWGDVGAASGPLFAALAHAAASKGYSHGSRAALWASSEGGQRAVTLLDFPTNPPRRAA